MGCSRRFDIQCVETVRRIFGAAFLGVLWTSEDVWRRQLGLAMVSPTKIAPVLTAGDFATTKPAG